MFYKNNNILSFLIDKTGCASKNIEKLEYTHLCPLTVHTKMKVAAFG